MGLHNHSLQGFTNWFRLISSILISIAVIPTHQDCYNYIYNGNFTANSTYAKNLNHILSTLASNASRNGGFYTATLGQEPEKVYALALCRGDSTPEICASCVNTTIQEIRKEYPNQTEAISWGSNNPPCIVHYANRCFFGQWWELDPCTSIYFFANITSNLTYFDQTWESLIRRLLKRTSTSTSKFATEETELTYVDRIYALMQCTPDLLPNDCEYCLSISVNFLHSSFPASIGGNVRRPSCIFEWGLIPFYNATYTSANSPVPPPILPPEIAADKGGIPSGTVVKIVIPTTVFIALIITFTYVLLRRKKAKEMRVKQEIKEIKIVESLQFNFSTIRAATNNFSNDCKLGQGGFGAVYKGKLPDGEDIAVKRLSRNSGQGELEFKNEVVIVARLQHRNLTRLLGCCLEGTERLLIYEFLPNSSLDKFLCDPIKLLLLDWEKRYKIIGGIARGILYLHEDSRLRVIHRDLKLSNILLDENMTPKISDFGMARLFDMEQSQDDTSRIVGTFGYMAPEYVKRGHFSVKSDVYSFGVLVLEIISGQKNNRFHSEEDEGLLSYVWRNWREGTTLNIIDPTMRVGSSDEIMRCIHIGLLCVQENEVSRPTMASVVLMLTSSSVSFPEPSEPAFFMHPAMEHNNLEVNISNLSQSNSVQHTLNEVSISELDAR